MMSRPAIKPTTKETPATAYGEGAAKKPLAKRVKTGGRQPGSPNKTTGEIKAMILQALSEVGGVKYLKQTAIDNPASFCTLIGKLLPTQVSGEIGLTVGLGEALDRANKILNGD